MQSEKPIISPLHHTSAHDILCLPPITIDEPTKLKDQLNHFVYQTLSLMILGHFFSNPFLHQYFPLYWIISIAK